MSRKHHSLHICACNSYDELHLLVKNFFAVDNFGIDINKSQLESSEDKQAREILEATTKYTGHRYETGLLWRYDHINFPDSFPMALRRLKCLEKKMSTDPKLALILKTQMRDYVDKSYARKLSPDEILMKNPRT